MREIQLTKCQVAIVDDEDYERLVQFKWVAVFSKAANTFYAKRSVKIGGKYRHVSMHREILQAPKGMTVDHDNHNGLDNRRLNISLATHQENQRNRCLSVNNTSGTCGVMWRKDRQKWRVRIKINGKYLSGGVFNELADAVAARDELYRLHGFHSNHGKSFQKIEAPPKKAPPPQDDAFWKGIFASL